ncbi:MAG TPA: sigma factor-like helix-turn-helix DNA-binding protein [Terriglobales bacterium]|nr:sigma factor-like helix-turn-helix DNA-binding protein [Terriglobales bacterium]
MSPAAKRPVWWDRDQDNAGRPIRPDVQSAARELWAEACRRTASLLADNAPAGELMEKSVSQVSRYLDRIGAPSYPCKNGLLLVVFTRTLRRYGRKLSRIELVGEPQQLGSWASNESWIAQTNARLDFDKIIQRLSQRSAEALCLRVCGYEWKEISNLLGTTVASVRSTFWREIRSMRDN